MEHTLESLSDRITNAALGIAARYRDVGISSDDVAQDITLAILERYVTDPDFLNQTPSYIVAWGVWKAKHKIDHDLYYHRYHVSDTLAVDDQEDEREPFEHASTDERFTLPCDGGVEDTALLRACLATLDVQTQAIAAGLMAGRTTREIGAALSVSAMTVCNRKSAIAQAIAV